MKIHFYKEDSGKAISISQHEQTGMLDLNVGNFQADDTNFLSRLILSTAENKIAEIKRIHVIVEY